MRHHYIPQFYLANFAKKERKRSKIWVTDKAQRRQWTTTPTKAAHRRNYYRISDPSVDDPDEIEHALASIESNVAPLLPRIVESEQLPTSDDEYSILLNFVGLMAVRVPGSRNATNNLTEVFNKQLLRGLVSSREVYEAHLNRMRKDGIDVGDAVDYEGMLDFVHRDEYSVETPQDITIGMMLMSFDIVLELLAKRTWFLLIAGKSAPDFVCSDRPVTLDWMGQPSGFPWGQPGFGMPDSIVRFPLSPRVALAGLFANAESTCEASAELVAQTNACTGGSAERFIYSATQDFVWMHRDRSLKNLCQLMDELASQAGNGDAPRIV